MSDEKEFNIDENTDIVNSWDENNGVEKGKTLVKTLSNQTNIEKKEEEKIPFSSPSIDFTTILPIINENTINENHNEVKPIVFENKEPNPIISLDNKKEEEKPIIEEKVEEVENKEIIEEEMPIPVVDIPQVPIYDFENLIKEETPIKDEVKEEIVEEKPIIEDIKPIEINVEQNIVNEEITNNQPIIETAVKEIPIEINPQQNIINNISQSEEKVSSVLNNPITEDELKKETTEEDTMSKEEINKNFASVIQENNNQALNENDVVTSNTFTNIFDEKKLEEKPIDEEIATKIFKENVVRTPLDTTTLNIKKPQSTKKRIIPAGYGLGIVAFIIMFIYILNIDKITQFINEVVYNLNK